MTEDRLCTDGKLSRGRPWNISLVFSWSFWHTLSPKALHVYDTEKKVPVTRGIFHGISLESVA